MYFDIFCQLLLATFLGAVIGFERESRKKFAGLRTYSLVALGTCLFTIISFNLINSFVGRADIVHNPGIIIQAMAMGIGFLGAGVIFRQPEGVVGLTTAAGLWATAAIGVAVGAKFYFIAVSGAILALFILLGFGLVEEMVFNKKPKNGQ